MAWKIKQDGERLFVSSSEVTGAARAALERAARSSSTQEDAQDDSSFVEHQGRWWKVEPPPAGTGEKGFWLREADEF